jgi:hypothetical protein
VRWIIEEGKIGVTDLAVPNQEVVARAAAEHAERLVAAGATAVQAFAWPADSYDKLERAARDPNGFRLELTMVEQ